MLYRTGHVPDHPAVVAARVPIQHHPEYGAMRAGTFPLATYNRAKLPRSAGGPGLRNQKKVGACEGFANSSGATLLFALMGQPLPEPISAAGTYIQALMVGLAPNADGTLPLLVDQGTGPAAILGGWLTFGGALESVWGQLPVDTDTLYLDPTGANPNVPQGALIQPSPNHLWTARACRLNGAYFLATSGAALVRDLVRVMASGRVLTNAIPASGSVFQSYSGGVLGALSGPVDHAQLVVDYTWLGTQAQLDAFMSGGDDTLVALVQLSVVNSWGGVGCPDGGDWGEVDALNLLGGQYRAGYGYVQCATDWMVLDLRRV